MKKLYDKNTFTNNNSIRLMLFAVLILTSIFKSHGQVRVPFAPRTSSFTPSTTIYSVKGDFSMIGNTNLTLVNYNTTGVSSSNDHDMKYVDIDGTDATFNSSSATLTFSDENGAIPDCSNIVYAGLYWTGRASARNDSNTFEVTKNDITKTFDKTKVLLKGPNASDYIQLTANSNDIYFPNNTDNNIYSAYTEITQYVRDHGIGEYFVADIATKEGSSDSSGLYGGWGMVVIYENSKMKWRNITVFDGHAYVRNAATLEYEFPISGFNAVQNGNVNLKIGMMAGEGDNRYNGDYFQIERRNSGIYESLTHASNSANNFFNSSIETGGNARNPILQNNTGLDIAMFNINNLNNGIIDNNQTSTTFRYGSTIDTYAIFNVTFAVDAYVPEPVGVLTNISINGNVPTNQALEPNQFADYKIELKNSGTEAINNTVLTVPIPDSVNPADLSIEANTYYTPLSEDYTEPSYDPISRTLIWNLGTLPVPEDPDFVLANISFKLTITTVCTTLSSPDFDPILTMNGTISGTGATSDVSFSTYLIQGYESNGPCMGEPIPAPHVINIDYQDYINQPPTASNPEPINVECLGDVPAPDINVVTDAADNSGEVPIVEHVSDSTDVNNPRIIIRTYSVTDDCGNSINVEQTITVQDVTPPVFVEELPSDITVQCDAIPTAEILTATDNCGIATVEAKENTVSNGCNSQLIREWTATDDDGNTTTHTQIITLIDTTAPTVQTAFEAILNVSCADIPEIPNLEFTDNCSTVTVAFEETNSFNVNVLSDYQIVRTWTATDACDNSETFTQTINVTLDEVINQITAEDRCYDDGAVDLNSYLDGTNLNGTWELIQGDPAATLTNNIFDPTTLSPNQDFLPQDGGIDYVFRYTVAQNNCVSITELTMNINADCDVLPCGENDVVISKALTPNGDGINETFDILGIDLCGFEANVKIFNRWGALMYESDNYQVGEGNGAWTGRAKSSIGSAEIAPNGTYYYIVTLKNSGLKPFTGPIYLGTK